MRSAVPLRLATSTLCAQNSSTCTWPAIYSTFRVGRSLAGSRARYTMSIITEAPKASSSAMPKWFPPQPTVDEPILRVYNSLTRTKDVFTPTKGKRVDWYNCGPTVYDASHIGHARNYLTQDIIRRILRDYFGYDVNYVQNITDIDDKIILRARESHLLREFGAANPTLSPKLLETVKEAFSAYYEAKVVKNAPATLPASDPNASPLDSFAAIMKRDAEDPSFAQAAREKEEKWGMYLSSLTKAKAAILLAEQRLQAGETGGDAVKLLVDDAADVLGPLLGSTLAHTIADPISVCRDLSSYWEARYFEDMQRLHILRPDTITRVSEYIPEIVTFVERIVANGFAYEGGGSIWFDVNKFEGARAPGQEWAHEYAKLQPNSKGNRKLLDEGEGALTGSQGKRQAADFALWKAKSRPGEPAWPSPWGEGRPGWHIECSVMASEVLGQNMDIHSGGVDLMFPHHDNELAQSEAYHNCKQWVNYFIHTGHLHIEGLKMSKSLKNFISIEDALKDYTARQLRLAFMLQPWNAKMDFKRDLVADVKAKEETIDNFFTNVKARIAQSESGPSKDGKHHYELLEQSLISDLHTAQADFRAALCDSFNTPLAITILLDLIGKTNIYFSRSRFINVGAVSVLAEWVTRMLKMFGLGEGSAIGEQGGIGWGKVGEAEGGSDFEAKLDKYLSALSGFRDDVRKLAIAGASSQDILKLCDRFRDQELVNLGVQLDDGQGADGAALYKLVDPAILIRQREEKAAIAADKAAKKAENARIAEEKRLAQLEKGKLPPTEMFKPPAVEAALYTAWDDQGIPTRDGEGKEVSKNARKKLEKEWKAQEKLYLAWKEFQASQVTGTS